MTDFKRELRYMVMKWKDVDVYLSPEESETLLALSSKICKSRQTDGKIPFNAVVVEQDWPEFEPTWAAIEARMTGKPSPIAALERLEIMIRRETVSTQGVAAIAAERKRQMEVEGWTPEHDDGHDDGELAFAAASYALFAHLRRRVPPEFWPWDPQWWKPKDRRSNLVRAGALIAAEIDRLDRAAGLKETE